MVNISVLKTKPEDFQGILLWVSQSLAPPLTISNGPANAIPVVRFCLNYKTELAQAGYINLK